MRRERQRRAAVFAAYQHDVTGRPLDDVFEAQDTLFTQALAHQIVERQPDLDAIIARHAQGWSIDRIAPLEKAILRAALVEMTDPASVPSDRPISPEGAIDAAVETAKAFCGERAPAFINGILGAVLADLKESESA